MRRSIDRHHGIGRGDDDIAATGRAMMFGSIQMHNPIRGIFEVILLDGTTTAITELRLFVHAAHTAAFRGILFGEKLKAGLKRNREAAGENKMKLFGENMVC